MRNNSKKQIRTRKKELLYYALITFLLFLLFSIMGASGYVLFSDSEAYLSFTNRNGVMPVYPLFLYLNRLIFGGERFLDFVVVQQTIWAVFCILMFYHFIRRRFQLGLAAACPILVALVVPFTINLPESITSQEILTEAIAYPLFYLYMIFILKTLFDKTLKSELLALLFSIFLTLIRTQMQLSLVITAAAWLYAVWRKKDGSRFGKKVLYCFPYIPVCAGIVLAGLAAASILNLAGQKAVVLLNDLKKNNSAMLTDEMISEKTGILEDEDVEIEPDNMTAQYNHVLVDKALYEMDYEDYQLFEDEEIRKVFLAIFERAEEKKARYVHARKGLLKWEDIMNGVAGGTDTAWEGWNKYTEENPDSELRYRETVTQISYALLQEHWTRVLYHILCMVPSGLICTVFFQNRSFYLLCHIITYAAYTGSLLLTIWAFRNKKISDKYAENMLGCAAVNVIMVMIMSIMFFPMQRYLVYGFGMFWTAFYILGLEFVKNCYNKYKGIIRGRKAVNGDKV